MKVSVIMSFTDRPRNLKNTLLSWAKTDYPDCEFVLTNNGSEDTKSILSVVDEFKQRTGRIVTLSHNKNYVHVNRVWNKSSKETSSGTYVIFAMADEIVTPDIITRMVAYGDKRCSVNTYFLSEEMSKIVNGMDWVTTDPKLIETLPDFWEYEDKGSNNRDKTDASLLSHVIGWTRKQWEWFGWFRDNPRGHLWLDQDVVIRSRVLGIKSETVAGISCYHQWHPTPIDPAWIAPGYHPVNERQARLLEESDGDES